MKKYFPVIGFAAAAYGIIYWLRKKASAGSNLRYEPVDVAIDLQKIKAGRISISRNIASYDR